MFIYFGATIALCNSYYRLTGYVDNGLTWNRKNNKLRKYDFTSEHEKGSFWGYFRIRDWLNYENNFIIINFL